METPDLTDRPVDTSTFGARLNLARRKAGYSLRGLSDALDHRVSAQAIGRYERGEMMPGSGALVALTQALGVTLSFLFNDQVQSPEDVEFRKASGMAASQRAQVEAEVIDYLQRYLAIEEILGIDSTAWNTPLLGHRFLGREGDGERVAQDIRQRWNLGIDPIPDLTSLLEIQGIKVLATALPGRVAGLTCFVRKPWTETRIPVIVVNRQDALERRRFTLAHELGHCLFDKESPVNHEKAADVFAGAFLASKNHLVWEIGAIRKALDREELILLKHLYRMGAADLLVRLERAGIIGKAALSYAFRTYARGWKTSEPEPLEGSDETQKGELPQRFERLCRHALAEKFIALGKAAELLSRPAREVEQGSRHSPGHATRH